MSWGTAELEVNVLTSSSVNRSLTCLRADQTKYLAFNTMKTFHDTGKFCASVGGRMAVAEDSKTFDLMNQTFSLIGGGHVYFYSGHHKDSKGSQGYV